MVPEASRSPGNQVDRQIAIILWVRITQETNGLAEAMGTSCEQFMTRGLLLLFSKGEQMAREQGFMSWKSVLYWQHPMLGKF